MICSAALEYPGRYTDAAPAVGSTVSVINYPSVFHYI